MDTNKTTSATKKYFSGQSMREREREREIERECVCEELGVKAMLICQLSTANIYGEWKGNTFFKLGGTIDSTDVQRYI